MRRLTVISVTAHLAYRFRSASFRMFEVKMDRKAHRVCGDQSHSSIGEPSGDHSIFRGALVILLL